jgi:hypothetical protein
MKSLPIKRLIHLLEQLPDNVIIQPDDNFNLTIWKDLYSHPDKKEDSYLGFISFFEDGRIELVGDDLLEEYEDE